MTDLNLQVALDELLEFRRERDWEQFHTPKNLSMSIAIEAAELMEHFQWKNDGEVADYLSNESCIDRVKEEIADVAAYLLLLSHDLEVDLNRAIIDKVAKNRLKYPVEKSRGRHNKYTDL